MAELVAAQLRARIVQGDLQDGDELPREADLRDEFGVSRPSLREAIRILETEGLLRIRRGKIGGALVKRPDADSAAYHLGLTLQARAATLGDLAAAREVLAPTCAGLLAALPDDRREEAVATLTALVDGNEAELGASYAFTASALTFHAAIVDLCGNTTIAILTSALEAVWSTQERQWAEQATAEGDYPEIELQRGTIKAHRRIVQTIAAGDVPRSTRVMREHLAKSQAFVGDAGVRLEVLSTPRA